MLNLYSIISLSNITNAFIVTLHSNMWNAVGTNVKNSKFKRGKKGKEKTDIFLARDRSRVASVTDRQDNNYTTPTADSVSEIKYLYMHPCLLLETNLVKLVIAFND